MAAGIYKIVSPSGKVYVGQSVDINTRFSKYRSLYCPGQRRLCASFKKYGVLSHAFEIIEEISDEALLVERVVCLETGMVFEKIQFAADFAGLKRTTLNAMLRGQSPNRTSLRYA